MMARQLAAQRDNQAGITLIEMLVSLVIFAFVGLASFTMLDTLLKVRERTEGRLETVAQIDRAMAVFSHDFAQGDPTSLMIDDNALRLIRAPDQRHSYGVDGDKFLRTISTKFLDENTLSQLLVPDVRSVVFEVLDSADQWQLNWPVDDGPLLPRAVRMTLSLAQDRVVTRTVALTDIVVR